MSKDNISYSYSYIVVAKPDKVSVSKPLIMKEGKPEIIVNVGLTHKGNKVRLTTFVVVNLVFKNFEITHLGKTYKHPKDAQNSELALLEAMKNVTQKFDKEYRKSIWDVYHKNKEKMTISVFEQTSRIDLKTDKISRRRRIRKSKPKIKKEKK